MSTKYPGGIITKNYTAPTPTSASGIWTLEQQEQAQQAGIWPYGGPFNYIEDVFSTYLYTGAATAQTITNNIDISTKGGLVWIKKRNAAADHWLTSTANTVSQYLGTAETDGYRTSTGSFTAFNTTGFSLGNGGAALDRVNTSGETYVSWTFRKQPKFFDVVTYTGTGSNTTISHNLGSVPGCIIVKRTDTTGAWQVYHGSLANTQYMVLNTNAAVATGTTRWNSTTPTSTVFSVGTDATVNASGGTYVAYLFANNAGGFGLTGTDNVITCGTYTGNGTSQDINLGYEPQWILVKDANAAESWGIEDVMRGMTVMQGTTGNQGQKLVPNTNDAETTWTNEGFKPTPTGFNVFGSTYWTNFSGHKFIYIAIRRGPMKVPTDGTKVFKPVAYTGNGSSQSINAGFPIDLSMFRIRGSIGQTLVDDRLRGVSQRLFTDSTAAETTSASAVTGLDSNTSVTVGANGDTNSNASTYANWSFRRAPSFFDEVCYTGTGSATTFNHNLGAVPEMMIMRTRSNSTNWVVYHSALGNTGGLFLDLTSGNVASSAWWNSTTPTSSVFTVGTAPGTNNSAWTFVAYLFASCPGVSKVGSYTGNGSTQAIACGFTGGARFVLIKRTDSASNWFVWDTARGMVAGTDPSLALNSTAAESNANSVYTIATGFQLLASPSADVNTNGGSYIYLAIA